VRFRTPFLVAALVLAAQLASLAADVAVLRNGFSIRHSRREQIGQNTRLYTADGYVDVPTEQIASFETEETPPPQPQDASPQQPQQSTTAVANTQPVPTAQPVAVSNKVDIDALVRDASFRRQLDPDFVSSVIKAESNFRPRAVSSKGAQGLMQLMPDTAARLGVRDAFDPRANVEAGTQYLSNLLDLYHNDPIKALAAYNAGTERVRQYNGVPPFRETKWYIYRIVRDFNAKKQAQTTPTAVAQSTSSGSKTQTPQKSASSRKTTSVATHQKRSTRAKTQQASASVPQTPSGSN
jgi:soluble lytic murein transglycosylase-like protein